MNGIDKIISHIEADSNADIEAIKADSARRCEQIRVSYEKSAHDEYTRMFKKGVKEAELRIERLGNIAALEAKKQVLGAKQKMVSKAFDRAMEMLSDLSESDYTALLASLAVKASSTGTEKIMLSAGDRTRYGKTVCVRANEELAANGRVASLTLSEKTADISGGLILSSGNIDINCSIETLVAIQKSSLAFKVAAVMFD